MITIFVAASLSALIMHLHVLTRERLWRIPPSLRSLFLLHKTEYEDEYKEEESAKNGDYLTVIPESNDVR